MRILLFGDMAIDQENNTVVKGNINQFFMFPSLDGLFDQIIISLTLPLVERTQVPNLLKKVYDILTPGGSLIVQVPMAEHIADKIIREQMDVLEYYMLYGNASMPYRNCYTLFVLRVLLEDAGFITLKATQGILTISTSKSQDYQMPINEITATRRDDPIPN